MTAKTSNGKNQQRQKPATATAKTSNGNGNGRFLRCDAHGETVSIFGRNDGIGWVDGIGW
jgi:hypothetical protein